MDIAIVLFDGFDNLDVIGPFEVFNHARSLGVDIDIGLYTLSLQEIVRSNHGLQIQPDGVLTGDPDLVVVPGGGWADRSKKGVWAEAERGDIPEVLARIHDNGTMVASVCTGGMLLARAGITDGRPAITHHDAIEDLRESGANVQDARVVDDGDLVTAGGITAGIDLAIHIIGREFGQNVASHVETRMEYNSEGDVYKQ